MNKISKSIAELKTEFKRIKNMGWIKSKVKGCGGIGVTLEKLIGIDQNELEIPDYNGIEIKTKRSNSKSYTNLFNCAPEGPHYHEIERLKNKYGYPDSTFKQYKVLSTSVYSNCFNEVGIKYYFKLKIDRNEEKIFLQIFDKNKNLLEDFVYWSFDTISQKLYRKLNYLAFVKALNFKSYGCEYFKYDNISFYKLKNFDTFIQLIEKGIVRITFKIGIFKSGKNIGNIHDHGTSFNIQEKDILKLYDIIDDV